jgi:hypothetical protein
MRVKCTTLKHLRKASKGGNWWEKTTHGVLENVEVWKHLESNGNTWKLVSPHVSTGFHGFPHMEIRGNRPLVCRALVTPRAATSKRRSSSFSFDGFSWTTCTRSPQQLTEKRSRSTASESTTPPFSSESKKTSPTSPSGSSPTARTGFFWASNACTHGSTTAEICLFLPPGAGCPVNSATTL